MDVVDLAHAGKRTMGCDVEPGRMGGPERAGRRVAHSPAPAQQRGAFLGACAREPCADSIDDVSRRFAADASNCATKAPSSSSAVMDASKLSREVSPAGTGV
jgi:hypothetical protein